MHSGQNVHKVDSLFLAGTEELFTIQLKERVVKVVAAITLFPGGCQCGEQLHYLLWNPTQCKTYFEIVHPGVGRRTDSKPSLWKHSAQYSLDVPLSVGI